MSDLAKTIGQAIEAFLCSEEHQDGSIQYGLIDEARHLIHGSIATYTFNLSDGVGASSRTPNPESSHC
jgi:hypothetical protein